MSFSVREKGFSLLQRLLTQKLKDVHIVCSFGWRKAHHRLLISQWDESPRNFFGHQLFSASFALSKNHLSMYNWYPPSLHEATDCEYLKICLILLALDETTDWIVWVEISAWWLVTISHDKWKWDKKLSWSPFWILREIFWKKRNQLSIENVERTMWEKLVKGSQFYIEHQQKCIAQ